MVGGSPRESALIVQVGSTFFDTPCAAVAALVRGAPLLLLHRALCGERVSARARLEHRGH
jgi:hypothetical protein